MYFLLLAKASTKLLVVTEKDMYDVLLKENENGRMAESIEVLHAEVIPELALKLVEARNVASREVRPR